MLELPAADAPAASPVTDAQQSDPLQSQGSPGAPDTPETNVAETDEQKNQREINERAERSQRQLRGVAKRINELTGEKHGLQRQNEMLLAALINGGVKPPATVAQPQGTTDGEPVRGADEDYESWVARKAEWRAEQRAAKIVADRFEAAQRERQQRELQGHAEQVRSQFESKVGEFAKANAAEWDKYVAQNEDVHIPDAAIGLIHMDEKGPELLVAIGKNPALAAELQRHAKAPLMQAMVIGRISAALSAPPQVSKAPQPGQPVGSRSAPSNEPSDSDSMDAWLRKRNEQLRKR